MSRLFGVTALYLLLAGAALPASAQSSIQRFDWCGFEGETTWANASVEQGDLARMTLQIRCVGRTPRIIRAKIETLCGRVLCTWGWSDRGFVDGRELEVVFETFSAERTLRLALDGVSVALDIHNQYRQDGRPADSMQVRMQLE